MDIQLVFHQMQKKTNLDRKKLFFQFEDNVIGRSQSVVKNLHVFHTAWHYNTQTNSRKSSFFFFPHLLSFENSVNAVILALLSSEFPQQS